MRLAGRKIYFYMIRTITKLVAPSIKLITPKRQINPWKGNDSLTTFITILILSDFFCLFVFVFFIDRSAFTGMKRVQIYSRQQNYLRTCDFSGLIANFCHLMLVINSIQPKDHVLTNIYFIKLH